MKKRYILDIEADSLTPTQIWCAVIKDYDTGEVFTYREPQEFNNKIQGSVLVGHNLIGYDVPALNRLWSSEIKTSQVEDTLVLSRLFNPVRKGGHSLDNFGEMLGFPKTDFSDFSSYSDEMLKYCINDVELTYRVYIYLLNEGQGFSQESIVLEHNITYILTQMKEKGFKLNVEKAKGLYNKIKGRADEIVDKVHKEFRPQLKWLKDYKLAYNKDGSLSKRCEKVMNNYITGEAQDKTYDMGLYELQEFNLGSPKQIVERMDEYGWRPVIFSPTGQPRVCEENMATLPDTAPSAAKLLGEYLMASSRYKLVKSWIDALGDDGRVHGSVISVGAITHRMAHRNPNMANIPGVGSPYGEESRQCWTVDKGRKLVGVDAKGIQLRMLAHYMNDPDYIDVVVNGDIHTKNLEAMGIDKGEWNDDKQQWTGRNIAKTFIYAWLLGAGDTKVGQIIGGTSRDGKLVKDTFLRSLPALARLKQEAEDNAKRGYMEGLDGRRIPIKSAHYALSAYLQGGETVVMKRAMLGSYNEFKRRKLDAFFVAMVHDEFQIDCREDIAEQVANVVVRQIQKAGEDLKLNCLMDGDYRIGDNWLDTH